eukprot:12114567-Alexandrium_andersonii.AAC.1
MVPWSPLTGGPGIPRWSVYLGQLLSSGGPLTARVPARRCGRRRLLCLGWPRPRRLKPGVADSPSSWRSRPLGDGLGSR